jgi:2'-5' RNA ligase
MRLFVALEVPEQVRENLTSLRLSIEKESSGLTRQLHPAHASDLRWVPPENFHVTLKFIGEVGSEELPDIAEELRKVRPDGSVKAVFRGLGFSWKQQRGGVFWATMVVSDGLKKLAAQIDRRLENHLGIPAEDRDFLAHLTVARFKRGTDLPKIREAVAANVSTEFGTAQWQQFALIVSKLGSGGSQYTTLKSFRFAAMAAHSS